MRCLFAGIDSGGHAANFVETEQIVLYEGAMASFVQVSNLRSSPGLAEMVTTKMQVHQPMCFLPPDTRFHTLLLESEAQPQIQTQTHH